MFFQAATSGFCRTMLGCVVYDGMSRCLTLISLSCLSVFAVVLLMVLFFLSLSLCLSNLSFTLQGNSVSLSCLSVIVRGI
jgi:hypothetical protein